MNKFILWNKDKSDSFDLSQVDKCFAISPKGLGTNFEISKMEAINSTYINNIKPKFEPISLHMVFGAGGRAHQRYNELLSFISRNGKFKFILEYQNDYNIKQAEVWLSNAPKTERTEFRVLEETFLFERVNYWYLERNLSFELDSNASPYIRIPMSVPWSFAGWRFKNTFVITNDFFEPVPIEIVATGAIVNPLTISILDNFGNPIDTMTFLRGVEESEVITISSADKTVVSTLHGNVYNLLDKTQSTFLYIPNGEYTITTSLLNSDTGEIKLLIKQYLLD